MDWFTRALHGRRRKSKNGDPPDDHRKLRAKAVVILALLALPVLIFVGIGAWALWETGYYRWVWMILPVCWLAAYLLARLWKTDLIRVPDPEMARGVHWTPQDDAAAEIVEQKQAAVRDVPPLQLTDPKFYFETALELSHDLARHYHPKARDPVSSLTVPEILAAVHLAFEDLEEWVSQYVPGSHLLTVHHWRTLAKAPGWFKTATNVSWAAAMLFRTANLGRYALSKFALEPVARRVQENVLAATYVFYVRRVGFYLIEMNSGRLRGGAARYREAVSGAEPAQQTASAVGAPADEPEPLEVTIALIGQVDSGKSSLIRELLGERQQVTDVVMETRGMPRYRLEIPGTDDRLVLVDTPGWEAHGPTRRQRKRISAAMREADLVLLLMDARERRHAADWLLLRDAFGWFESQRGLKPPPILGVLTHVDRLEPEHEWSPPYTWEEPATDKEHSIHAAAGRVRGEFGDLLAGVVPVCADVDADRVYGVREWLLPAVTGVLDQARACALLRTYHAELDRGKVRRIFKQLAQAGQCFLSNFPATGAARPDSG